MEEYKKGLATVLAGSGALFFDKGLFLKDGRPTPFFVNMGMFRTGKLAMEMGSFFAAMMMENGLVNKTDIILGPSYKGSAIALSTALALYLNHEHDLFFDYDRKEAKTHGEGSTSSSLFVNRTLFENCRIFIVDDVATSMGTKYELIQRLEEEAAHNNMNIEIVGIGIAIDREQTTAVYDERGNVIQDKKGENAIQLFIKEKQVLVYTVAGIREVVEYLFQEKLPVLIEGARVPIDEETKFQFDAYMNVYGID
ncbi:orotate phosphoribosyltransferase [Thermodesulfobacteriota bacterium]